MSILSLYAEKMVLNCVNIYNLTSAQDNRNESYHYINKLSLKCYSEVNLCSAMPAIFQ